MDMTNTIIPKSDQINADDLIAGPRTITIARVTGNEGNAEQPVNVFYEGDNGKPYRPCKGMRRVMVSIWGADAATYVGRSMTLYRDPTVTWGGMAVGGIRISHMSHMEREVTLALTASKTNRRPFVVKPLRNAPAKPPERPVAQPPHDADAVDVEYVATSGTAETVPLEIGIRKMRAAHKAPKLSDGDWFDLFTANADWLEQHAPDVAAELSVRGAA